MDRDLKIVDKKTLDKIITTLKESVSVILSDYYYYMLFKSIEERTIEDNLALIQEVEKIKEDVFLGVLGSFNDFVKDRNLIKSRISKEISIEKTKIEGIEYDRKKIDIITLGVTFLLPTFAPIILVIGASRLGLDKLQQNSSKKIMDIYRLIEEEYDSSHKDFYQLEETLRTDYHESKKRLKELKEKALIGQDIIDELIKIMNPESLGIPLQEFQTTEVEEKPKQFIK